MGLTSTPINQAVIQSSPHSRVGVILGKQKLYEYRAFSKTKKDKQFPNFFFFNIDYL